MIIPPKTLSAEPNTIEMDAELTEQLKTCAAGDIAGLMHDAAIRQHKVTQEADPFYFSAVPEQEAAQTYSKTLKINGVEHTISGESELALAKSEEQLYRQLLTPPATPVAEPTRTAEPARNEKGQFISASVAPDAAAVAAETERKQMLMLDLSLGRITMDEYLEKSNAVGDYLAAHGLDTDTLKEIASTKQADKFQKGWEQATEAFKAGPGADWLGGNENLATVSRLPEENGLTDSADKVQALCDVWAYMKENNLVADTPEMKAAAQNERLANAKSPEEIKEALNRPLYD